MNHGQLNFPFRRYQIQPVWRADRPQKGRYREFYQCDADVVGSDSLLNEVELAAIYAEVFSRLGLATDIRINSRKLLAALAGLCGGQGTMMSITTAIDKLDKIGLEKVKDELATRGLDPVQIGMVERYLAISGDNRDKLALARELFQDDAAGLKGIEELEWVLEYGNTDPGNTRPADTGLMIDLTLARGLNYYTGIIFEVRARSSALGSIGGGGRYDDLTGLFGVPGIPGVGISFGVDRIYDAMEELQLFPEDVQRGTQVLFFHLGEAESRVAFGLMQQLRKNGVRCELYHEQVKFEKQFKYAEKKNIPFIVILGSKELADGICQVKDIRNGVQTAAGFQELLSMSFA